MNNRVIMQASFLTLLAVLIFVVNVSGKAKNGQIAGQTPDYHFDGTISRGVLENYLDRSVTMAFFLVTGIPEQGCMTPSGWSCESLPYLVELDNYGRGNNANVADTSSIFVWGWDEISWFSLQDEAYRNQWLEYAHQWIKQTDPNGHLQMPVNRMISCPNETHGSYRANTKSAACPIGYSQEETIKKIWTQNEK
jgi:hypothetical protein